jgi:hypothetical protein
MDNISNYENDNFDKIQSLDKTELRVRKQHIHRYELASPANEIHQYGETQTMARGTDFPQVRELSIAVEPASTSRRSN